MDIVIPFHSKDSDTLIKSIPYIKKNIINCGNIYLIGKSDPHLDECTFIMEDVFPFKDMIRLHYPKYEYRTGWIFQQLIKLLAWKYIPGLSENYLVWDSDTVPYRKIRFYDFEKRIYFFCKSFDLHQPYFAHIRKLCPFFTDFLPFSGICHHQIFSTTFLKELIQMVEAYHENMNFEILFLSFLNPDEKACCSEYELYITFMWNYHREKMCFRKLIMQTTCTHNLEHSFYIDYDKHDVDLISYHKYENQDI